jgi:hypothetical protein
MDAHELSRFKDAAVALGKAQGACRALHDLLVNDRGISDESAKSCFKPLYDIRSELVTVEMKMGVWSLDAAGLRKVADALEQAENKAAVEAVEG